MLKGPGRRARPMYGCAQSRAFDVHVKVWVRVARAVVQRVVHLAQQGAAWGSLACTWVHICVYTRGFSRCKRVPVWVGCGCGPERWFSAACRMVQEHAYAHPSAGSVGWPCQFVSLTGYAAGCIAPRVAVLGVTRSHLLLTWWGDMSAGDTCETCWMTRITLHNLL